MAFFKVNSVSTFLKLPSFITTSKLTNSLVNYGYIPDDPGITYDSFSDSPLNKNANVNEISIKQYFKEISNQGSLGSCVANASCDAIESQQALKYNMKPEDVKDLSRLFLYYNSRNLSTPPTTDKNTGSKIKFAFDSVKRYGICYESTFAYDLNKFSAQPGWLCYKEALVNRSKISACYRIDASGEEKIQQIKNALAQNHPTVFGIAITESFRKCNSDQVIRIPSNPMDPYIGSHALIITGYSASKEAFEVRNSWSENWGMKGFCYMHQDYIEGLSGDLWVPTV